jgi:hypothetical protein
MFPPTQPGGGNGAISGAGLPAMLSAFAKLPKRALAPQPGPKALRKAPGTDFKGAEFYQGLADADPAADRQLKNLIKKIRNAALEGRELLERSWWQKLLYINDRQWIYYSPRGGWQDKRMAKWVPRPVTNKCIETVETVRALLSSSNPTTHVRPAGRDPKDIIAAQMADDMEPVIAQEHDMEARWYESDFWAPATGTVFLHPYWDRENRSRSVFQQASMCPECGYVLHPQDVIDGAVDACPDCAAPADSFVPAVDEGGQPVGDDLPLGAGATDVVSCLEMLIPTYYQRWEDVAELIRLRWRPKSWYEGRPYAEKISYTSTTGDRGLQMFRALAMLNSLSTIPFQWGGATPTRTEGAIEAELWIKPSEEYPDGLWCRTAGGLNGETLIIRDPERGIMPGPLPYRTREDKPLWCWAYYPYTMTGGRIWAKGALDSVIQKQDSLNRNDSMVELIMQRMANPIWLEPKGAEVQRFTGEPGLIARYSVIAGSTAKPERIAGETPGQAFFALRAQHITDIETSAGTQDILKGIQPGGVEAFSALNLLVERSQSRFTPVLKTRGRAYREWYRIAFELERSYGPEQRVKAITGPAGTWTFQTFRNTDLEGSVEFIVEDGSERPKTALGKSAAMQQAHTLGIVDFKDPATTSSALSLLGITELVPSLDTHTKAANIEHDLYERWVMKGRPPGPIDRMPGSPTFGQPTSGNPLQVRAWNMHQIHVEQLDLWANSERMRLLLTKDPIAVTEVTLHRVQHLVAMQNPFGVPAAMTPPPVDLPKTMISLKGEDLTNPIVQQLLRELDPAIQLGTQMAPAPGPGVAPGAGPMAPPAGRRPIAPMTPASAAAVKPPQGGGMAMGNSNRESGAPDTLPGKAPGGGNMGAPA